MKNNWIELTLEEIILEYRDGIDEPLDGDDVDRLVDILRVKINLHEGNITEEEYNNLLDGEVVEDKVSFTYSFLRRKLHWEDFCNLTGVDYYAIRNGFEIKDNEIFYFTESQAKKFNLI